MIPPCLTLSIIRYGSRVKWNNPGKSLAPSRTPWCSSYRKRSLRVTLDYGHQLYFFANYFEISLWQTYLQINITRKTFMPLSILARLMHSAPFSRTTMVSSPSKARSHKEQVSALSKFMFYSENICILCISICQYVNQVECITTGWVGQKSRIFSSYLQGGQVLIANAHHITWDPYRNCCTFLAHSVEVAEGRGMSNLRYGIRGDLTSLATISCGRLTLKTLVKKCKIYWFIMKTDRISVLKRNGKWFVSQKYSTSKFETYPYYNLVQLLVWCRVDPTWHKPIKK